MEKIVLMYHDVYMSDPSESGFRRERDYPYKVPLEKFESQVDKIVRQCTNKGLPLDSVIFTFDDGGRSFLYLIAPVLEKYGFKGHFYISTKYIGTEGFLTSDEIKELERRGHIVGSHAHSHEHLYKLSSAEVKDEWEQSCSILSNILGHRISEASIPNGDISEVVLNYALRVGLKDVFTSKPTTIISSYKGLNLIGRYVILRDTTDGYLLSIIVNATIRTKLYVKWCIIYCIKRILGNNYVKLKNFVYRNK